MKIISWIPKPFRVLSIISLVWMTANFLLRLILMIKFFSESWGLLALVKVLLVGALMDFSVLLVALLPISAFIILVPYRLIGPRLVAGFYFSGFPLLLFGIGYLMAVDYFFFDEFVARFNYVAVDYLIYPHEVFTNIWEAYPVIPALLVCAGFAIAMTWFLRHHLVLAARDHPRWKVRLLFLVSLGLTAWILQLGLSMDTARWTPDRTLNEISQNALYSFFYSFRTASLDYNQFYATLPPKTAWRKVKAVLGLDENDPSESTLRVAPVHRPERRPNVVFIIMESFGSEFSSALTGKPGFTPSFDYLTTRGLLFDHAYATGNRTIRGLEAILTSFPPLPGLSVVKRDKNKQFSTLARVMKKNEYQTLFLYGGRGVFDGMESFMSHNGFDRFVEQKDFKKPTFTTAWGVCDEDLFDRALEEFDAFHAEGKSFFSCVLTVSNHKPFTYPEGRIPEDPNDHRREHAVAYADYALGQFFEKAAAHAFNEDTLYVIVGDHGARIYGSSLFPLPSYRVPILMYGPKWVGQGERCHVLASSMDISPTVLSLLGWDYTAPFYGKDLLNEPLPNPYVLMQHNRDVAIFDGTHLVSLGLSKQVRAFQVDPETLDLTEVDTLDDKLRTCADDAVAIYQTAYWLYDQQRYFDAEVPPIGDPFAVREFMGR